MNSNAESYEYEHELRCMTYNIKNDYDPVGDNIWSSRKELVAGNIRFHRPDLIGMQEVLHNQLEDLAELLPEYGWVGVGRDDGKQAGEYSCIFYRKKRLRPLEQGTFWLSEQPEQPGSMGWDAACTRVCSWVKLADVLSGKVVTHYNTHFDHIGQVAVEQSAHLIKQQMEAHALEGTVILTGDFNMTSDSEAYRVLTQQEQTSALTLRDASVAGDYKHFGPAFTFQDFDAREVAARSFPSVIPSHTPNGIEFETPIDFIFVNGDARVVNYGIVADHCDGKLPSDHYPVVADVIL